MKTLAVGLLLGSAIFLDFRRGTEALQTGAILPNADEPLCEISGQELTLHKAMGANGLLVMFTSNICPYVLRNQARTNAVCRFAQAHQIGVVLLNSNEAERQSNESLEYMKIYAREQGFSWYYAVDQNSHLADAFGADHTPDCYLFDRESKLVYKGGIDDNPGNAAQVKVHYLQHALEAISTGKTVTDHQGEDVGCSIKRM
ncbi:Redoxin [Chitinophaga costaii]|uniref:Redoxin n=1 Tax=Chitinophaga costaii TaxID=1335309 RepID=A0A1C4ER79_9BACT|nr:redoxin family protein [Chitinophaga costaii]PUZ22533.1 thiol-disulfide isomerase [Chitinophaga costaii]SCC46042.1 Redoxin [Chitinophaga costaii]